MTQPPKKSLDGVFITFEGIDGCGKSTQAVRLVEKLRAAGGRVMETREPGGTQIGMGIRSVLLDPAHGAMIPSCELLLYLADRVQHLHETILPAMGKGWTVVCDRYHDATVAYQRHGRGLDFAPVEEFIAREIDPHPPDLTFWLDVGVETGQARIAARNREHPSAPAAAEGRLDNEKWEFHNRVREGYLTLHKNHPRRMVRINGEAELELIGREIWMRLGERYVL